MSRAFVHLFNTEYGGHGVGRKYDPKVHLKHAEMYDDFAKYLGIAGGSVYYKNPYVGNILLGASAFFDGLKHLSLAIVHQVDQVGLVIDYVVPVAFTPYGPAVGEAASQTFESLNNYLEENYK